MNCKQCPYISHESGGENKLDRPMIIHPQGNFLQIEIPISIKWTSVIDSVETTIEQGTVTSSLQVSVELIKGKTVISYTPNIVNNMVSFIDRGKLPIGTYDIVIIIVDGENQIRYKQNTILRVVDAIGSGPQYGNNEFNVFAVYPMVEGKTTAISISPEDVTISEAGKFKGDDTPSDNYADISAIYGDSSIEVGEDDVTITL
jgi:hypothetical protein